MVTVGVEHVIVLSRPALATGSLSGDMTTVSFLEQLVAVFVMVKIQVFGVLVVGCAVLGLLNPAAGDQEQVYPPTAGVPNVTLGAMQLNDLSGPAFTGGKAFTL